MLDPQDGQVADWCDVSPGGCCILHERVESVGASIGAQGVGVGEGKPADLGEQGAGHKGHCNWWQSGPQRGCVLEGPGSVSGQRLVALGPEG